MSSYWQRRTSEGKTPTIRVSTQVSFLSVARLPPFDDFAFQTQAWYANRLITNVTGADGSVTSMSGKLAGIVLRFSQPNLYTRIQVREAGVAAVRVCDGFDVEFDSLVSCFGQEECGNPSLSPILATRGFYQLCEAFVHTVLGWHSNTEGLFGYVHGYLGQIHHHGCNGPIFHAVVWVEQPNLPVDGGYATSAMLVRGDPIDGPPPACSIPPLLYLVHSVNASTQFCPILSGRQAYGIRQTHPPRSLFLLYVFPFFRGN